MTLNGWRSLYNEAHQSWDNSRRETDPYRSSRWAQKADRDLVDAMFEAEHIPGDDPRRAIAIAKTFDARATMFNKNPHPDEARGRAVGILDEAIARGPYDGAIDAELTALRGEIFAKIPTAPPTQTAPPTSTPQPTRTPLPLVGVLGSTKSGNATGCWDVVDLQNALLYEEVRDYQAFRSLLISNKCAIIPKGSQVRIVTRGEKYSRIAHGMFGFWIQSRDLQFVD
jgi:hypothetical protein